MALVSCLSTLELQAGRCFSIEPEAYLPVFYAAWLSIQQHPQTAAVERQKLRPELLPLRSPRLTVRPLVALPSSVRYHQINMLCLRSMSAAIKGI